MAARNIWHLKWEGQDYTFDPEMLLVGRMRKIKRWFPDIGRYSSFILALSQGDPDAALCALWIVRMEAGEKNVPEPERMPDFSLGDFFHGVEAIGEDDAEADPTEPPAETSETSVSTETPTNSESDISGS
ncbi:MAG TPA: hypothetical protein VGF95_14495 [Solirubrobacteraceae bacterium]|jgi:hypothetical protein